MRNLQKKLDGELAGAWDKPEGEFWLVFGPVRLRPEFFGSLVLPPGVSLTTEECPADHEAGWAVWEYRSRRKRAKRGV